MTKMKQGINRVIVPVMLLAVCLLLNAGCGKKGPPVPAPLGGCVLQVIIQP